MKFEGSGSKGTQVIERKRSVTDGQTDRRIDGQGKNNMSPPEGGGDIILLKRTLFKQSLKIELLWLKSSSKHFVDLNMRLSFIV